MFFARALSVLFVSLASVAFESLLTRYFAVASWSEYGYWVISIAMVGYSFSGVVLALARGTAVRHAEFLLAVIPPLMIVAVAVGYYFTTINPFNPIELQNPVLWTSQLLNIGKFYLALFPFFFLAGLFLGLSFLTYQKDVAQLYAADLLGAGAGAACILGLMFVVHPFYLAVAPPLLLFPVLILQAILSKRRVARTLVAVMLTAGALVLTIAYNHAQFFQYKAIYPVLNVHGNRILEEKRSPRGYYLVLDNFTERRDLAISNNLGNLGLSDLPLMPGLYKDGNRVTSLAGGRVKDASYAKAALCTLPYELRPGARTLLVGTSGGARIAEAHASGCGELVLLEPEPVVGNLIREHLASDPSNAAQVLSTSPQSYLAAHQESFDVIDIAEDYLDSGTANKYTFTQEAVEAFYRSLSEKGILSLPVSIREFAVFAVKMTETARAALVAEGVEHPENHIAVCRSEWAARVLVSKAPLTAEDLKTLETTCSNLSFDRSYFPGIDPAKIEVWNDLPRISFEDESVEVSGDRASDALRDDLIALLSQDGAKFLRDNFFDLGAATNDRPFLQYIIRPTRLERTIARLDLIPHEAIGTLINVAVLAQAAVFALLVLTLPMLRVRSFGSGAGSTIKTVVYFAVLGVGFLGIEITLIEKFTYLLNDSVSAFAITLSGMLVCSGVGSFAAGRLVNRSRFAMQIAVVLILVSLVIYAFALDPIIVALLDVPNVLKIAAIFVLIAPISFALGMPFPLGMAALSGPRSGLLPVAWGVNGAFSVISSPLASIIAGSFGYRVVFLATMVIYPIALLTFPSQPDGSKKG